MCRGGQYWICSGAMVVTGGYAHVWWWICSCVKLVNGGLANVYRSSLVDMLMCSGGE